MKIVSFLRTEEAQYTRIWRAFLVTQAMLSKLTAGVNEKSVENEVMEHRMRYDKRREDERLKQLYEEMDVQMSAECDRIRREEERKFAKRQNELEAILHFKESQLASMQADQARLQQKLNEFEKRFASVFCYH